MSDAHVKRTSPRGRPHRKLALVQIALIQKRRAQGEKLEALAADFRISRQYVCYLTKGPGRIQRGICRYCRCTHLTPCLVSASPSDQVKIPCSWLDDSKTVCNAYNCRIAFERDQRKQESN